MNDQEALGTGDVRAVSPAEAGALLGLETQMC